VIFEAIDDEIVIINLDVGHYYHLTGVAAAIWTLLERNGSKDRIVTTVAAHFNLSEELINEQVQCFLDELENEKLVILNMQSTVEEGSEQVEHEFKAVGEFVTPRLEKYADMKDLLLIDPIHEVDEHGWPNRPPAVPAIILE